MNNQVKIVDKKNKVIVLALNNNRFNDICLEVQKKLAKKSFYGEVIFDLLISNGLSHNRFVSLKFDNDKFIYSTVKELKQVDDDVLDYTNNFYKKHKEYIHNSILPRTEKQRIIRFMGEDRLAYV